MLGAGEEKRDRGRVIHRAGTWTIKVPLRAKSAAQFRRHGLKRVTLTLRVVVVPDQGAKQAPQSHCVFR